MTTTTPETQTTDGPTAAADTTTDTTPEAFAERVFAAVLGAQEVQAVHLGNQLGYYRALADHGPSTSAELAARTATDERYTREWLEQQGACGYVTVDDPTAPAAERRFELPAGHAEVLVDETNLNYMAPFPDFVVGLGVHLPALVAAYRSGAGISWADFGDVPRAAQGAANRPMFVSLLGQEYFASVPEIDGRLRAGGRVADLGCGLGWSAIGIALAYPDATVDGFDVDAPSVELAQRHAIDAGVADRVSFHVVDGAALSSDETYDLVCAFECVHDLADPVAFLGTMRGLAGDDGIVVVMDERTGESYSAPADEVERLFYGFSITCCLPDGRAHGPSECTGTVMRPGTLASYAKRAGFGDVEVLDIDNDFFRFYRLA